MDPKDISGVVLVGWRSLVLHYQSLTAECHACRLEHTGWRVRNSVQCREIFSLKEMRESSETVVIVKVERESMQLPRPGRG